MAHYPFLDPRFLAALEDSGSAVAATGWTPCHRQLTACGRSLAFMPLYLKTHSMGEYVFDWSWADAYRRHGLAYYPKLLTAIPFTPTSGPRVRFGEGADRQAAAQQLIDDTLELAADTGASSWHLLFPDPSQLALFADPRLLHRKGVQYHWFNRGYHSFDDFLVSLTSRKRKMIRRERRQVAEQGFVVEAFSGAEITPDLWRLFALFYQRTYVKRSGSSGYLTPDFFARIGATLAEQCLLVTARRGDAVVAAAFYLFDDQTLYGRYWGCLREYDFLHFELCYYRGIEFAISRGLAKFDAGAQGEHKIVRGFEPVVTHSLHWIAEPAFRDAIARFLGEEDKHIRHHLAQARELLPYRQAEESES